MSVIGIDFGNDCCYIAVARQGGIETIANDYSLRATPAYVGFGEKNRVLGVAAKNQMMTNMKNTCFNFKRIIGKKYRDPRIQEELKDVPYKVFEQKDGSLGIKVHYLNEEQTFSATQVTAMLLTKLKHIAETALGIKVVDVVIGVPFYFDDATRHAMLEAALAAGLNVLRLMNETTAVALAYGIYKQDLPAPEEKPRNVIFVDCGQSSLQVSAVAFNKGKLKMLTAVGDECFGGRNFDHLLAGHFAKEFKTKYKVDAHSNCRAWFRLLGEVEKLKKQMSANSTELPISIECFMNDKDVNGRLKRADLEEMASPLLKRVESTLSKTLTDSGLKVDDVYSVEVVGGMSRVPAIKGLIEKVFKKSPSTTLNADEAVSRGCALQCAMLSPTFKVREFSITDVQPYKIDLFWTDENGKEADMEVFPRKNQIPFSKMLTFYRREPFTVQAKYASPSPCPDPNIGHFTIQDVSPTPEGESQKVKVKVRVNLHGMFTVASASLTEKKEVVEDNSPMETESKATEEMVSTDKQNSNGENPDSNNEKMETEKENEANNENNKGENEGDKKPKKVSKTIDLPILVSNVHSLPKDKLNALVESEAQMVQNDKLETDRINAKNAVEEYVYEMRNKISEDLKDYIEENESSQFRNCLDQTENWLYEDGEDCTKQIYINKLTELRKMGDPVSKRKRDREELPMAFEALMSSVQQVLKSVRSFRAGDEKLDHLDPAEVDKVEKALEDKRAWVDKSMGSVSVTPLTKGLPVTAQAVRSELSAFEALVNPIMNKAKPKPKVEDPPAPPASESKTEENGAPPNGPNKAEAPRKERNTRSSNPKETEPMDVD